MGQWVCLDRKVGREQQAGQPCALCMLHSCTQAFEQSFWGVISSQIRCYKSGAEKIVTSFSLVSPQLLADFSSRSSCFSSAAPGVVWASRQLATFSGDTSVSRESTASLWIVQFANWCVWLCGPLQPPPLCHSVQFSVFMEGIQLQTGWTRCFLVFFLGFASMICLVLLFPPKVNGVYGWFTHMHEKAALRGGLYCLHFYLECLICSMSCRDVLLWGVVLVWMLLLNKFDHFVENCVNFLNYKVVYWKPVSKGGWGEEGLVLKTGVYSANIPVPQGQCFWAVTLSHNCLPQCNFQP